MNTPMATPGARPQRGFTLIELMVTVGVMAILAAIAAPSVRDALMNVRMSAQVNDLMSDLSLARAEAIRRGVPVRLCPANVAGTNCSGTNWATGWIVFVDDNNSGVRNGTELVLRSRESVRAGNTVVLTPALAAANVPFRPSGTSEKGTATTREFRMCDGRTTSNVGRKITISATGRPLSARCTCPACP